MSECSCRVCKVDLVLEENWHDCMKQQSMYYCLSCYKEHNNNTRMYVNGKYIPKSHPLYKAGRYKSFNDAAFSNLENYTTTKDGHVYIITNPAWPDWVKIGMAVDAEDRLNGYQTSSPMRYYQLEYSVKVNDRRKSESKAHKLCKKIGVDNKGEWFNMSVDTAKSVLERVHG